MQTQIRPTRKSEAPKLRSRYFAPAAAACKLRLSVRSQIADCCTGLVAVQQLYLDVSAQS